MPKGYSQYNQSGWHHCRKARVKMSAAASNKPVSGETRHKMSLAHLGKHHSEEHKLKMSQRMSGKSNPMFGKTTPYETKAKISLALKGIFAGSKNPMAGRFGATHPNWKGGIAYLPYSAAFNNGLKEKIRTRDSYTCQECGIPQAECLYPLASHHINYNKEDSSEYNLISLCEKCHGYTNYNREYWQRHFEEKIAKIYTLVRR